MAITAYVGKPGHGKSHSVVEHVILPAIKAHRTVVTNVALYWDKLREAFPGCDLRPLDIEAVKANPASIEDVAPAGCVLVLDEVWKLWPAGQTPKDVPTPFKSILAEHRHRVDDRGNSMQVVLVTQDLSQVGKFARDLIEETFRTVQLKTLGSASRYRVDVYTGGVTGDSPPERKRVRQLFGKYRAEVWRWYQSHTKSESGEGGANETKLDGRGVVWKSPAIIAMLIAIPFLLGFGVWAVVGFFSKDRDAKVEVRRPVESGGKKSGQVVRSVPASRWRIMGEVAGGGVDKVFLEDVIGDRVAVVSLTDYCQRDLSGFLICTFEGQTFSNQIIERPRVVAPASPVQALLGPADPT